MIVYNITVKVDGAIADAWLHWQRAEHGPKVLATGLFQAFQLLHLIEMDDAEGRTYAVQYQARTRADYEAYQERFAAQLEAEAAAKWGSQTVSFSTLMQVVG